MFPAEAAAWTKALLFGQMEQKATEVIFLCLVHNIATKESEKT